jgi:hypothetical protein
MLLFIVLAIAAFMGIIYGIVKKKEIFVVTSVIFLILLCT